MQHRMVFLALACALASFLSREVEAQESAVPGDQCETIGESITDSMKVDLLDPAAPLAARQKALDAYKPLADESRCPEYGYSIGLLYRFGSDLPGNLLQKDAQKARDLILRYAEDGNLMAYADLAEMALANGDAREAMRWTQVYLALLTQSDFDFRTGTDSYNRSGYNGDLLLRAEKAWGRQRPKLPRQLIRSDLAEYLGAHETRVLGRIRANDQRNAGYLASTGPMPVLRGKCEVVLRDTGGAYARYLIEVQPDGHVSRVTIKDFAPRPDAAIKLAQCVKLYEFKPFAGPAARIGIVPVMYGYTDGPRIGK